MTAPMLRWVVDQNPDHVLSFERPLTPNEVEALRRVHELCRLCQPDQTETKLGPLDLS